MYRTTWSKPSTAQVLANVPNYMVLDDHEIVDGWGDGKEDQAALLLAVEDGTSSARQFVAQCGWQVYNEYQAVLNADVPDKRMGSCAHFAHVQAPNILNMPRFVHMQLRIKVGEMNVGQSLISR